jgi:hypothetical protein
MPAPRRTTVSARKKDDVRAVSVLPSPLRSWPTAENSPSVVPPTQRASGLGAPHSPPALSGSRRVETVVPGIRYGSTVGQKSSVYWSRVPSPAHQVSMWEPVCQPRGCSPLPHS